MNSRQGMESISANKTVPVQNYITAILVFLVVEMLMTWGFYGKSPLDIAQLIG